MCEAQKSQVGLLDADEGGTAVAIVLVGSQSMQGEMKGSSE